MDKKLKWILYISVAILLVVYIWGTPKKYEISPGYTDDGWRKKYCLGISISVDSSNRGVDDAAYATCYGFLI